MSFFKCKMCGGTIEPEAGATVCVCSSCGTRQTLPTVRGEALEGLFNRANTLRMKCDFDKAEEIYGKILTEVPDDAEAHWGSVLCRYGIEYVEDPITFRRIPTCHRTSYESVAADADYLAAIDSCSAEQRELYISEATEIDRIQKDILEVVRKEKPFDVFICYKETDENGRRTVDSAIANDIYHELTEAGFKVFYAAITLEDKLGEAYEPYIFAALTSARVMLAVATKPEYYSSVWVKNEWSRFLRLSRTDRHKLLIPCYRNMETYEFPPEFAHLQAEDMDEVGFINDIVRGIGKLVSSGNVKKAEVTVPVSYDIATPGPEQLIRRVSVFLEDGKWEKADEYCERILGLDATYAGAYLGKLMAEFHANTREKLKECDDSFDGSDNYRLLMRFCDEDTKAELAGYLEYIKKNWASAETRQTYERAVERMKRSHTEMGYKYVAGEFKRISGYKNAEVLAKKCLEKAEECRKDAIYNNAVYSLKYDSGDNLVLEVAKESLESIRGWRDTDRLISELDAKINRNSFLGRRNEDPYYESKKELGGIIGVFIGIIIFFLLIILRIASLNN